MPPFLSSLSPLPLENNQFLMTTDHYFTGDADLEAVVRGYNHPQTCFSPLIFQQDDHDIVLSTFPDLFETSSTLFDELEELYKPFYTQSLISSSDSGTGGEREPEKVQDKESFCGPTTPVVASALGVKQKRRKAQHKRVVKEVRAEGLSSDMWAWRKYGQKPIKGSPYPRSYYRCSSLKGCLARKQVERSQTDPEMFVITYTADHCHSQPTRRSSLAGTTRQKFSHSKTTAANSLCSPISSSSSLSPPPKDEEQQMDQRSELVMSDMVLGDDFFVGFDELDRLTSDLGYSGFSC
ncbi:WRKY transcription factor 22-like [Actinidia eriantha]|uniref:WRKY transcription factor 22-like n=1 Tax=Actinidia eriantha TaxID=165200 RepID=UPI0025875A31|nr:WRKY transcription factor 22-like [Actinidia eriantha]